MKPFITLFLFLITSFLLFGQEDKIQELISQGIEYHDQGKYDDAISKYKEALKLDKNSALANYELSYTYFMSKQYDNAIKYSAKVIKQNTDHQHASYVVLGSCYDIQGKPLKAIEVYKEGLSKFQNSYLLNYNIALTYYHQKDYEKAEMSAINAITYKPNHSSSHLILSAIMLDKGQRVKSILPIYYFLMLEPNSKRSLINYSSLRNILDQGVVKKDDKNININIPHTSTSNEFSAAETMISLLAASKFLEDNATKNEFELFSENNNSLFSVLGELKKENTGFWWDFYVSFFYDIVQTENFEAYSYYISQSLNNEIVNTWIAKNPEKMQKFNNWMNKY